MLTKVHPKLPMRSKSVTLNYYVNQLEFRLLGSDNYDDYLMIERDDIQIHFFLFPGLDPLQNYGQVYSRTNRIEELYQSMQEKKIEIHPSGHLQTKPWGQKEFSLLDPDNNLLTFGQTV